MIPVLGEKQRSLWIYEKNHNTQAEVANTIIYDQGGKRMKLVVESFHGIRPLFAQNW